MSHQQCHNKFLKSVWKQQQQIKTGALATATNQNWGLSNSNESKLGP
jgi:hypothetical protein